MERRLALVRATHLNDYMSVLRDIGAPVDRELARSKLPAHVEQTPDLYVSVPVAIEWIARTGHDLEPMELGLMAARKATLASLRPAQQAALATAQTGLRRLAALAALAKTEDSILDMSIRREADSVRVVCDMVGMARHPFVCLAEWLNIQAIVSVVRSVAGPSWHPKEMCFVSRSRLPETVCAAFPDTRILLGQPQASVLVDSAHLARSTGLENPPDMDRWTSVASEDCPEAGPVTWEFACLLRKLIQPYLSEGHPTVAFASEMAGISTRTLQRRLEHCGSSYSRILQEARFELARIRLDDPDLKIIDVAMTAGYESPQHFTRAFRRFTGTTPTAYRQHRFEEAVSSRADAAKVRYASS